MKKSILLSPFLKTLTLLFVFVASNLAKAQCPVTPGCVPGNPPSGNVTFGMGILNVDINNGAINNSTAGVTASTGYVDYSCTIGTSLLAQAAYPVSIQTNSNVNENVKIWIDFDNNGSFNTTTELVFSSLNKSLHTGFITIPGSAVTNTALRMRVSADNFSSPLPTPCSTPQYSQVEDYRITVTPNTNPPVTQFVSNKTTTCSPAVAFQDQSQNGPTSWSWNFGDAGSGTANTSALQNPTHTFSVPGTYTITLTTCNANGCNTEVKANYITYHTNIPVAAACIPATANYCCGYGITNVNFGNGLMTNASANGAVGYEDFTCAKSFSVRAGAAYPIVLTTGNNPQDTRIYIDLNNDGAFTGTNEMVLQILNAVNPSGTITIPATATLNTSLRMRIVSDQTGTNFTSCSNIQSGQAEDYTVTVLPNTNQPIANFKTDSIITCSGIVPFQDLSTFGPTSWSWDFGDPASGTSNTSTLQNPSHTYPTGASGVYTVTLTVCNGNGCNTVTKTNYVNITPPCRNYCISGGHNNSNQWITNVNFGSINNTTGQQTSGYGNFTNISTNMMVGTLVNPLTVAIAGPANRAINAWIDFNKDGIFQATEKVMSKGTSLQNNIRSLTQNITIPANVTPGPTRMRIILSISIQSDACVNGLTLGETEDYTINFIPNTLPVKSSFSADLNTVCSGAVQFTDQSQNVPTSWLWYFGDGTTSTLQNPSHTYATASPAMYTVSLVTCKSGQCDSTAQINLVNITVPCNYYCASTGNYNFNNYISNVNIGSINNTTGREPGGYGDYTHLSTDLVIGSLKNAFSINNVQDKTIQIWIDFNRDRIFQANELAAQQHSFTSPYVDSLQIPTSAIAGPTRMRIITSNYLIGQYDACTPSAYEEVEDYTVVLKADPNLPVVVFSGSPLITCNGQVSFVSKSTNSLTTYTWDFGDPASGSANNTSVLANPSHTFSASGYYTITLTACNSVGCTTVTKTNYINYDPANIACNSVNLPNSNQPLTTTFCNGLLFDNGGSTSNYNTSTYNSFATISPAGAAAVSLTFTAFNLDPADNLIIHDGPSFNDPVIGVYSGNTIPKNGAPIISSNGPLTVELAVGWNSNGGSGFAAQWSCVAATVQPIADFDYQTTNSYCITPVDFINKSSKGATTWTWNFGHPSSGSSNTSHLRNPSHTYPSGFYNVTLTACNSFGCDVLTKQMFFGNFNVGSSPLPATCPVRYNKPCCGYGISQVLFNRINNNSQLSAYANGYEDFGCFVKDTVQAGSTYPLSITTGTTGLNENVKAWIDYNNNGTFDSNELILTSNNKTSHTTSVTIPLTATRNQHLRMRIISDEASKTISNGCYDTTKGQIEDYSICIVTSMPNGISASSIKGNLKLYPNPATGEVNIKLNNAGSGTYQFEILNTLGQVLGQKNISISEGKETKLDLSAYRKGMYLVRITNENTTILEKVILE